MTWTGTVLLIADNSGDELFVFPDPADLTTFTMRNLPSGLTQPTGMTWTGVLRIADGSGDDLFTFTNLSDLTTFTTQPLPSGLTSPRAMTWTGDALRIVDDSGDELFVFPDPDDLSSFTIQDLPASLATPRGAAFIPAQAAKTLYGVVYTVADSADQSDEEAFVWTICPQEGTRIRVELATGVPEVVARVRTSSAGAARIQTELSTGVPEVVARVRTTPQEPHCQVSTLPAPSARSATSITYSSLNLLLDDELKAASGDSYAQTIILTSEGNCFFLTANRRNNQGSGSGPQMVASWEVNPQAIVLMNGPGNRLEMPGPNWPGHAAQDPDEPFFWALAEEQEEALETFLANFDPDVPTILMLCDLPLLVTDARIQTEWVTGVPEVVARVRTSAPMEARIQSELQTGVPQVTALVRTTVPGEERIVAELVTGVPEVVARIRTTAAGEARIRTELVTGVPAATARVRTEAPAADGKVRYGWSTVSPTPPA